jgi:hypothetical protein
MYCRQHTACRAITIYDMSESDQSAAGEAAASIDALLDRFERELRYFVFTRDHLGPHMRAIAEALPRFFETRSEPELAEARAARSGYLESLAGIGTMLEEWVSIRGSGEKLWEAEPYMTQAQVERHQELLAIEFAAAQGREEFDLLNDRVRRLLLVFGEATG